MKPMEAEAYEWVGRLATEFSLLERNVKVLLDRMIGKGPFTLPRLHDLTFHKAIERCQKETKLRFVDDPKRQGQVNELMERVDTLRERRNLFIHGHWIINEKVLPSITVKTFKLLRDETFDVWEFEEDRTSISGLQAEFARVEKLQYELLEFIKSIKPVNA